MDGSVSASAQSTERARDHLSQLLRNRTGTSTNNAQGSLFEQLLSIPVTPQVQPQPQCCEPPSSIQSSPESSVSNQIEDQAENQVDEIENDSALEDVTTVLISQDIAVPLVADGDPQHNPELNGNDTEVPTAVACQCSTQEEPELEDEQVESTDELLNTTVVAPQLVKKITPDSKVEVADEQSIEQVEEPEAAKRETEQGIRSAGDSTQQNNLTRNVPVPTATDSETPLPQEQQKSQAVENAEANPDAVRVELKTEESSNRRANRREKWFERDNAAKNSPTGEATLAEIDIAPQSDGVSPVETTLQDIASTLGINVDEVGKQIDQAANNSTANVTATVAATQAAVTQSAASSSVVSVSAGSVDGGVVSSTNSTTSASGTQSGQPGRSASSSNASTDKTQSSEPTDAKALTQQERVRLIQRVSRSFNRMTAEGGQINLRLHPQNLGSLNMQVQIEGRSLSAKLMTETAAARDAILQDLPALRQRLADQGYDVAKFQVEVANNGADAAFGQQSGQSQSGESSGQSGYKPGSYEIDYRRMASRNSGSQNVASTLASAYSNIQTNAGIDVHA